MRRSLPSLFGFWFPLLGLATLAHACGIGHPPDSVSTLPGLAFLRPDLLLLFPILAGTIERPFYTLAGYRESTLTFSIQANLIASLVTGAGGLVAIGFLSFSPLFSLYMLCAPVLAILIKLWWFARVPREDDSRSRSGWFIAATIVSTVVIATIPLWMSVFGTDRQSWAWTVRELRPVVILFTVVGAIVTHANAFVRVRRLPATDCRRGFEVLPPRLSADVTPREESPGALVSQ